MTFKTSQEQIKFIFGEAGLIESYKSTLEKLPPFTMEMLHGIDPLYKKHEWAIQKELNQKLNEFMKNKEVFGLVLVLIMMANLENHDLRMLHDFTKNMLLKRLRTLTPDPEVSLNEFWINLSRYSELMRKFISEAK